MALAAAIPSGTITLLFTDIDGSTRRWEQRREAMAQALRRHDELLRRVIDRHGGYVFKTVGDAFCAAFWRATDAVAAALDAQRELSGDDWSAIDGLQVRMALHSGTTDERGGDYFGPTVNRVSRLLATAHGGQVIFSSTTASLLRGVMPERSESCDLGEHRLADLVEPEHVWQLVAPGLAQAFPPLRSLESMPNNLPRQLTALVGRGEVLAEIEAPIREHALVTLVGAGGVGKTRVALQVGANSLDRSRDGVWFVELALTNDASLVASTIASTLGLREQPERSVLETLLRHLKQKRLVLILDNCEHVIEEVAKIADAILRGSPDVRLLATSREPLHIAGEHVYRMPSLAFPSHSDRLTAEHALRYGAVALFVQRAAASDARFKLTDENARIVAEICRRLDGIPLAIELAAARVNVLSVSSLAQRLNERFRVLTGGGRDVLPRQQTLRAMMDWSHDLLDERERTLFRRFGIFVNGFTLEGAVAVTSSENLDELDVFDVLASLVDKSLMIAEPQGDALRYRLLESTRAYALEKLIDSSEHDRLAGRHLRFLRDRFVELRENTERTARSADLCLGLEAELEDLRCALDRALTGSGVIDGGELLASIGWKWIDIGLPAEGVTRCQAYLAALPASQSRLRARLTCALSFMLYDFGRKSDGFERAAEALEEARASGDANSLADALVAYAHTGQDVQELHAVQRALLEAEAIAEASPYQRIRLLHTQANFSAKLGDFETAVRLGEQLRQEHDSLGNAQGEQIAALNLAECEHARGQTHRAVEIVRQTLPRVRTGVDWSLLAQLLHNLAGYLAAIDDVSGALSAAREAIGIEAARETDNARAAVPVEQLALALALRGDLARAAVLEGYADTVMARYGCSREFTEIASYDRLAALLRDGLATDELARLSAAGAALTSQAAIALALEEGKPT